jgi:hypothetical protein
MTGNSRLSFTRKVPELEGASETNWTCFREINGIFLLKHVLMCIENI